MKKTVAKKTVAKKAPAKKAVTKKAPVKKAVAKKAPAKKEVAKKATKCCGGKGKEKCKCEEKGKKCECQSKDKKGFCFEKIINEVFGQLDNADNISELMKSYFFTELLDRGIEKAIANALANRIIVYVKNFEAYVGIDEDPE